MSRHRRPWIIAHRGNSWDRPENTRSAFDLALRGACDGMELDVQVSRDGTPVLWHDRTLAKAGLPHRRISGMDFAQLRRVDCGVWFARTFRQQRLLTLQEMLHRYGNRTRLFIEIKTRRGMDEQACRNVVQVIRAAQAAGRLPDFRILCFDTQILEWVHQAAPRWRCILNVDEPLRLTAGHLRRFSWLEGYCLWLEVLRAAFILQAHRRGKKVLTYTINTPSQARRALDLGVDGLVSDRADWLWDHLEIPRP